MLLHHQPLGPTRRYATISCLYRQHYVELKNLYNSIHTLSSPEAKQLLLQHGRTANYVDNKMSEHISYSTYVFLWAVLNKMGITLANVALICFRRHLCSDIPKTNKLLAKINFQEGNLSFTITCTFLSALRTIVMHSLTYVLGS